jgi:hypothetical protein
VAIAVTEAQRYEMHSSLKSLMGDEVANTMMEHLPPFGWADVARKSDIDRLDSRIDSLISALWVAAGIFTACFIGLFTLIATKF